MNDKTILSLLGTFWSTVFPGGEVEELVKSRWLLDFVRQQLRARIKQGANRHDDSPWDVAIWKPITLRESDLQLEDKLVYGDPTYYGAGEIYGGNLVRFRKFPIDKSFRYTPTLTDKLIQPEIILSYDNHFSFKDGYLWFPFNPFTEYPQLVKEDVDGKYIKLWATRLELDKNWLEDRLGYLLGANLPASETAWDWLNYMLDSIVEQTSFGRLQQLLASTLGVEVAQGNEEVEGIYYTGDYLTIATDKRSYVFPDSLSPVVSVGDKLTLGMRLVDLFEVIPLQQGKLPSCVGQVDIPQEVLGEGFSAGLSFPNREVTLQVDTTGPYTRVRFEILGQQEDIDRFWQEVDQRGESNPPTLAHLLAGYTTAPATEPTANDLPKVINPAEFIISNFLRNHWLLVIIESAGRVQEALPRIALSKLKDVLPPWVGLLFVEILSFTPEVVDPTNTDASLGPGANDQNELTIALEPLSDSVDDTYVSEKFSLSFTEESC